MVIKKKPMDDLAKIVKDIHEMLDADKERQIKAIMSGKLVVPDATRPLPPMPARKVPPADKRDPFTSVARGCLSNAQAAST